MQSGGLFFVRINRPEEAVLCLIFSHLYKLSFLQGLILFLNGEGVIPGA